MKYLYTIVLCFFPLITGCASILGSTADTVVINSSNENKYIKVYNLDNKLIEEGFPPLIVNLRKGRGYFRKEHYILISSDDNGNKKEYRLSPGISPLYFLNAVIPVAFVGLFAIDPHNGSMWSFQKKELTLDEIF
jgi:hypothetical protein